jgi:hypothetical protein
MTFNPSRIVRLMTITALLGIPANAQTAASSFEALQPLLTQGLPVTVKDETGRTARGKVTQVDVASFTLTAERKDPASGKVVSAVNHTFRPGRLSARWDNDSLANGTVIGLLVGAVAGGLMNFAACGSDYCGDFTAGEFAMIGALFSGGIGAGIGAGVDAAHRVKELHVDYDRASPSARFRITPAFGRPNTGISASIRF